MSRISVLSTGVMAGLLLALTLTAPAFADARSKAEKAIPPRPEELTFPPLDFEVPDPAGYRHEIGDGIAAYVAEDHTLPLVEIAVNLRVGALLDPADKVGLATLTGPMIRRGGTDRLSAEEFDEQVEFLAADISSFGGDIRSGARLDCLRPNLDECLDLFFEMLRTPGFEAGRLEVEKGNLLEAMKQRNDDAQQILDREWDFLLYGEDFFAVRPLTEASVQSITREDLASFHQRFWRPENMTFAISGDVETEAILKNLEQRLKDWPGTAGETVWPPPQPEHQPQPGIYHVEKDIPQGKVFIGHQSLQRSENWDNPDVPALIVMSDILGSGGFTSRITKRIRSDEGLAYSAGAYLEPRPFWPGEFRVLFQSKSSTVALAAKIALEEIRRMQDEPVTEEELQLAKQNRIESFPRRFESAQSIVSTYAEDEFLDRPHEYWQLWRERLRGVTAADVQRVAKKHLKPEELIILVVGKWEEIGPGDADQRAKMSELLDGQVEHLPLRNPMTMEPMETKPMETKPMEGASAP
jgi:predicted Zn-dependent peptidase